MEKTNKPYMIHPSYWDGVWPKEFNWSEYLDTMKERQDYYISIVLGEPYEDDKPE